MVTQITIMFADVLNRPVSGTTITLFPIRPTSTVQVSWASPPNVTFPLHADVNWLMLRVEHADYAEDSARLQLTPGGWLADNGLCRVTADATTLTVAVTLTRLRCAPTVHLPDDKIDRLPPGDAGGVLLQRAGTDLTYRWLFTGQFPKFRTLAQPVLDRAEGEEWERFHFREAAIDPVTTGREFYTEYGGTRIAAPRFAVALWVPHFATRMTSIDMVFFFHPSTARDPYPLDRFPFRGNYPYGVVKAKNGGRDQPYTRLPHRYLYSERQLVYQLLATRRQAVIVMPIAPAENTGSTVVTHWTPFQTPDRLARLAIEICHFLHREMQTTAPHLPAMRDPRRRLAGDTQRGSYGPFADFGAPPKVGTIVVSGFSGGTAPILSLVSASGREGSGRYPTSLWSANAEVFTHAWRELWDLDLEGLGDSGVKAFAKWQQRGDHTLRAYHSPDTWSKRDNPFVGSLGAAANVISRADSSKKEIWANELHAHPATGGPWSSVLMSKAYLTGKDNVVNPGEPVPPFMIGDTHGFVSQIGFGHAAALSGLTAWADPTRRAFGTR